MTASQRRAAAIALASTLALGGAPSCTRTQSSPSEPPPVSAPAAPANGHIDPAPYRAEIEATEALLYSGGELGDAGWKDLSRALLELHNAIVFHDTSAAARETSRRLFFFSAQVDAASAPKHSADELAVMRGVWEKIRADQFTEVDWFRAAAR
jgi:hypothetical protein